MSHGISSVRLFVIVASVALALLGAKAYAQADGGADTAQTTSGTTGAGSGTTQTSASTGAGSGTTQTSASTGAGSGTTQTSASTGAGSGGSGSNKANNVNFGKIESTVAHLQTLYIFGLIVLLLLGALVLSKQVHTKQLEEKIEENFTNLGKQIDALLARTDNAIPRLSSVTPGAAPLNAQQQVEVEGVGFDASTCVYFGDVQASAFKLINASKIECLAPIAEEPKFVTVSVRMGQSKHSREKQFEYVLPLGLGDGKVTGNQLRIPVSGFAKNRTTVTVNGRLCSPQVDQSGDGQTLTIDLSKTNGDSITVALENDHAKDKVEKTFNRPATPSAPQQ